MNSEINPNSVGQAQQLPNEVVRPLVLATETPVMPKVLEASFGQSTAEGGSAVEGAPPAREPREKKPTNPFGGIKSKVLGVAGALGIVLGGAGAAYIATSQSEGGGDDNEAVVLTIDTATTEATPTATPTPEKTPDPNKIFAPNFERKEIEGTTFVLDPDLKTVEECPSPFQIGRQDKCEQLHEITPNIEEIPNIEELKKEVDDKILMTAWLKINKGMSDSDIAANMNTLLADYKLNKGKIDHSFNIVGFQDADNYIAESTITIDDTYKIEPLLYALPNKYTPIELTSGFKAGFVVNTDQKILYFAMYDFTRGGVNQKNPSTDRSKYNLAYGYELTGNLLSEKQAQLAHKISLSDITKMLPVTKEFSKSLIPIQNGKDWHSVWYAK